MRGEMKKVLVSGLIGSGKSAACRIIAECGYPVYDCDSRTKALYTPELKARIEEALGVPFSRIGEIFTDKVKRESLQDIVYPLVRDDIKAWLEEQEGPAAFIESAVAHASELFKGFFDETLEISAPDDLRAGRNPKALERSKCQSRPENPDYVIINDGTPEELRVEVEKYLRTI